MDNTEVISGLRIFCHSHGISTNGILVITIQRDFQTEFCSFIVDFNGEKLLTNYPSELKNYREIKKRGFNVCFKEDCTFTPGQTSTPVSLKDSFGVFCCSAIVPYKPRRTDFEQVYISHDLLQKMLAILNLALPSTLPSIHPNFHPSI